MAWNGSPSRTASWTRPRDRSSSIIPDYVLPGVSNEALATILAGVLGTLHRVLGVALGVAYTPTLAAADRRRALNGAARQLHAHPLSSILTSRGPASIHRLDARVKLVLALAFILTTALTPLGAWPVYVLLFALVFAVEILSELGVGHVLRRAAVPCPLSWQPCPCCSPSPGPALLTLPLGPWT